LYIFKEISWYLGPDLLYLGLTDLAEYLAAA